MGLEQQAELVDWELEEKVSPVPCLRQGDLIAFQTSECLRKYGIVVTADCDLDQRKHARLVTLVPVVDLIHIVEYYLLPELCEKSRPAIAKHAAKIFELQTDLSLPEGVEELRARAAVNISDTARQDKNLISAMLLQEVDRLSISDYKSIMESIGQKVVNKLEERLGQQVRSKGDLLVLPQLTSLKITAYIAWVRHVWQVPLKAIAFRTSEVREGCGQRVARLGSPYRYRLTQLMAQVFSDIGLPDNQRNIEAELGVLFA